MRTPASAARVRVTKRRNSSRIERFAECLSHTWHKNDRDAVALALLVEKRRLVQRKRNRNPFHRKNRSRSAGRSTGRSALDSARICGHESSSCASNKGHAARHGVSVGDFEIRTHLDGMPERVAEVEQLPAALFEFVFLDDVALDFDAASNDLFSDGSRERQAVFPATKKGLRLR